MNSDIQPLARLLEEYARVDAKAEAMQEAEATTPEPAMSDALCMAWDNVQLRIRRAAVQYVERAYPALVSLARTLMQQWVDAGCGHMSAVHTNMRMSTNHSVDAHIIAATARIEADIHALMVGGEARVMATLKRQTVKVIEEKVA